jgi:hypothetical protein
VLESRQRLDQIERNMRQLAKDSESRVVFANASAALGYVSRYGRPMDAETFNSLASFFYSHARESAKDSIALGPMGPLTDEALSERLGAAPFLDPLEEAPAGRQLEENIRYIGALLTQRTGRPILSGDLRNWREWALGARTYARMLIEQPSNAPDAVDGDDPRRSQIAADGEQLRNALLALSHDRPLYDVLTQRHRARVGGLLDELEKVRVQWFKEQQLEPAVALGAQAPPLSLSDGVDDCLVGAGRLPRPHSLTGAGQVPVSVRLAAKVGAADASLCWAAGFVDITGPTAPGPGRTKRGTLAVTIDARLRIGNESAAVSIGKRTIHKPGVVICESEQNAHGLWRWQCDEAELAATIHWGELKDRFEQEATPATADDPAARDAAIAKAADATRAKLDDLERALRIRLRDQLVNPEANPVARTSALAASGAKALLRDTVALGFPQAFGYDDVLRALLDGDQAILDLEGAAGQLAVPAETGLFPGQRDVNPVAALRELATTRADRLDEALGRWHDLVEAGQHRERHALIEDTLDELTAARVVAYGGS